MSETETKTILETIKCPDDLNPLSEDQLVQVCREMREMIVNTISGIGGHLAPSLGTVDLTVALCKCLNLPQDRVVWDVGHQAYGWKLLTGRQDRFHTIRQHQGLSGFLKRDESEYDAFGAGHASTSIAAAWGMAEACGQKGENFKSVAVIGDGAMTGGLAFEALNNIGARHTPMLVVLNDNEMSISANTGAMSRYLRDVVNSHFYNKTMSDIAKAVDKIPKVGHTIVERAKNLESGVRHLFTPGLFFEALGFKYIGPVDGHDLPGLLKRLPDLLDYRDRPVLLHIVTQKGRGYTVAEGDPAKWHGVSPFEIDTGKSAPKPKTFTHIFSDGLCELGKRDKKVCVITGAMPDGTGTTAFGKEFPSRFYDVGIAEGCGVTFAAGLATQGMKPICAIYSTFLQRAYDHIVHDVAIQRLPVIFIMDRGGLVGADGATHHGVLDLSYMRSIPNMTLMAPKDEAELLHMLHTAAQHTGGPIAMRYPRGNVLGVPLPTAEELKVLPIGKSEVLSEGGDVMLLATGNMVQSAMRSQQALQEMGIDAGVVNMRFIKPLDEALLTRLVESGTALFSLEDNVRCGGLGGAINEWLSDAAPHSPACQILSLPDEFIEQGPISTLHAQVGLSPEQITARVAQTLERWKDIPKASITSQRS